jgi:PAS domain-containing protein
VDATRDLTEQKRAESALRRQEHRFQLFVQGVQDYAVQIQQRRIAQLSSAYMARPCIHRGHAALSGGSVEIVIEESSALIMRMDVLCRCALVLCGLEQRSTHEAALMLGVDQSGVH